MRSISMAYPTIDLAATGAHIRQLRLEQGYSVQDLQTYLGLEHPQAIYHWQHGRNLPSVDNLYALSKLWGVPMDKIIGSCYYSTIAAMHILTTLWSTSYAATLINGCLVREKTYIRWINYVLGTQYTNQRATQLWEIGKLLQLDDDYWVHRNPDLGHLLEDYPPECADRPRSDAVVSGCLPF